MQTLIDHGRNIAFTGINRRDFAPLRAILADTAPENSPQRRAVAGATLFGALHLCAQVIEAAGAAGVRFAVEPITPGQLAYARAADEELFDAYCERVANDIAALCRGCPEMRIDWPPAAPIADGPLDVRVVEMPPAGEVAARIVAMPDRMSQTTIERDKAGNIVRSNLIETDA